MDPFHGPIRRLRPSGWDFRQGQAERFASIAEIGQFYFLTVDHGRMIYSISKPSELKGINIFGTLGRSRATTEDVSMFAIERPCFEVTIDKDAAQEFRGYSRVPPAGGCKHATARYFSFGAILRSGGHTRPVSRL